MTQFTELPIANQSGLQFRQKNNAVLSALNSSNAGETAPTVTEAYMKWLDTSTIPPTMRQRDSGNSAWELAKEDQLRVDLAASSGSELVGVGGGRTQADKNAERVSVKDFGAVGDGVTDDTAAFQSAMNSFGGNAGTAFIPPGNYLLNTANITVPRNVTLQGPVASVGEQLSTPYRGKYDQTGATLYLSGNYSFILGDCASVVGVYVLNSALKGALPFPDVTTAAAAVAAFSGTAFSVSGRDVMLRDVWIGGFNQAFYSKNHERTKLYRVDIDCTNGVWIENSTDVARITDVHCWPFLTAHQPWTTGAVSARSGSAFKTTVEADGITFVSCFDYGWNIGFDLQAKEATTLIGCFSDGAGIGTGQIGYSMTDTADLIRLVGCGGSGKDKAAYINTGITSVNGAIEFSSCNFWGNKAHIWSDQHRMLIVSGCEFRDTNGSPNMAIRATGTVTGRSLVYGNAFDNSGGAYNFDPAAYALADIYGNHFNNVTPSQPEQRISDNAGVVLNHTVARSNGNGFAHAFRSSTGASAAPAAVPNNAAPVSWAGYVHDGAQFNPVAQIRMTVRTTPSAGNTPGSIIFGTSPANATATTDRVIVNEGGHLYPLTDNAYSCGATSFRWSVLCSATGTINTSDARLKTDVADSALGLDFINRLRPVSYRWISGGTEVVRQVYRDEDGNECDPSDEGASPAEIITRDRAGIRTHWGLLAQEVKQVADEFGVDFAGWTIDDPSDPDSRQGLRYDQFIAPIIKTLQEVSARQDSIEQRLKALEIK